MQIFIAGLKKKQQPNVSVLFWFYLIVISLWGFECYGVLQVKRHIWTQKDELKLAGLVQHSGGFDKSQRTPQIWHKKCEMN